MVTLIMRAVRDDEGQDLVEYALLALLIGLAGVLVFPSIRTKMGNAFNGWGSGVNAIWIPNDPS
jgi:Flp pilus assembly pilin Flp